MYTDINFKTKKALKEALASGKALTCYQPGMGACSENGKVYLEGPHYPEAHKWYAEAWIENGILVKVK